MSPFWWFSISKAWRKLLRGLVGAGDVKMNRDLCGPCLAVWSSISSHPLARLRASSSRMWWVCASGREHGAYCERWRFIVFLTVARAGCPHAAATISAALDGCRSMPNSCIRELGENPMGCLL